MSKAPTPAYVSLTNRWAACLRCARRFRAQYPDVDDGLCDLCDTAPPDGMFNEVVINASLLLIFANVCARCLPTLGYEGAA